MLKGIKGFKDIVLLYAMAGLLKLLSADAIGFVEQYVLERLGISFVEEKDLQALLEQDEDDLIDDILTLGAKDAKQYH